MIRCVLVVSLLLKIFAVSATPTSGTYKTSILKVKKCEFSQPFVKEPIFISDMALNNTSKGLLLSGNLTITRDIRNVKVKLKSYLERNNKWELNYYINGLDCHGILLNLINIATQVRYDRKTCTYFKGTYTYKNLDPDYLQHLWKHTMEYGKTKWRIDVTVTAGTLCCWEFDTLVSPLEKSKN